MMGVCYAPYHQEASVAKSSYTKADVDADLSIINSNNFTFIRTYTVQGCQEYLPELCTKYSIGLALGVWIYQGDSVSTEAEIDKALKAASLYPEMVKVIVIGNEVDLAANGYTLTEVQAAFEYAVTKLATHKNIAHIPLTICMTGSGPVSATWSTLLSSMQSYAFLTIYPWYGQKSNQGSDPQPSSMTPGDITANMQYSYENGMQQAIDAGLEVVIAEIGWPSDGCAASDTNWAALVSNFSATCAWISGTNSYSTAFITMWFEMFDEPWKTAEGAWGPHWGIYGSGSTPTIKTDTAGTKFPKSR